MADLEELQQKEIELDLSNVPKEVQSDAKAEVGAYLLDEILTRLGKGESPVSGEKFRKLSKKYADRYKGGNTTPNLELEGDMLAALDFSQSKNGVIVGIMDKSQRPKADGHNNLSGQSLLAKAGYQRRFIPASDQNFKKDIMSGVQEIIAQYEQLDEQSTSEADVSITDRQSTTPVSVTVGELFNSESLAEMILRRLRGG